MARSSGAAGGIWIIIALIVYVIAEWGKVILYSLGTFLIIYVIGYFMVKRKNKTYTLEIIPPDEITKLISEKARLSKVFNSIKTQNRAELLSKLIDMVYPDAVDLTHIVKSDAVFDEKLNYLVHAAASKLKKNNKTKK